jgi:hypothetical protein
MRLVTAYEIVDHGPDAESYFPGCGVAFTKFDQCFTGMGATAGDALNDAIDQAMLSGDCDFPSDLSNKICLDWLLNIWSERPAAAQGEDVSDEWHYYVSLRVKF